MGVSYNADKAKLRFTRARQMAPEVVRQAALDVAMTGEAQTKKRFVPVGATGMLQASVTGRVVQLTTAELRTNNIKYAPAQEFRLDYFHPNRGPTGERGADYIGRGGVVMRERAKEALKIASHRMLGGK